MTALSSKQTKKLVLFFLLFMFPCISQAYFLVFVHIGRELPSYLYDALSQARLFNKSCDIYLLANKEAFDNSKKTVLEKSYIKLINLESLKRSKEHEKFLNKTIMSYNFRDGFWVYASERFLYLYEFVKQYNLEDVIHLETDIMVYTDFNKIMPILQEHYKGIGVTLDADHRCIPGIVFFRNIKHIKKLANYFADNAHLGKNDMEIISHFYHENIDSGTIDMLPIIMPDYHAIIGLGSTIGKKTNIPEKYSQYSDQFLGIFDGAALGQYLGGIDPRNGCSTPGFINETCIFNPARLAFIWEFDEEQRKIPFAIFKEKKYKIYNLHIHSKNLAMFRSINIVD